MREERQQETRPAVCALPAEQLSDRAHAWRDIATQAIATSASTGRVATTYRRTPEVASTLRRLIAAEAKCCPSLTFEVDEHDDLIEVDLRFPVEFEPVIFAVLSPR
jgi:hypothetical protein